MLFHVRSISFVTIASRNNRRLSSLRARAADSKRREVRVVERSQTVRRKPEADIREKRPPSPPGQKHDSESLISTRQAVN